jgi:sigma-B regulation protein RsbU (phosphoserine phosphatase)
MQGHIGGVALELKTAGGARLPVLVNSVIRTSPDGEPMLIRTTVFDARDRRSYERELLRARREADHERERLQLLVTTLQRSLLPPALPNVPGLETAAHYHFASLNDVGGDFYDLFPLSRDRWGLFLGDVSGKGADAATVTSLIRYTLRAAAVYDPNPGTVLSTLNDALREEYERDDGHFCTAVFGLLSPDGDGFTLTLASGGHPLLLYTDGLTEARTGPGRDRYGDDALLVFAANIAPATAGTTVNAIIALLDGFGDGLDDDIAVLALGVPPLP